MPYTTRWNQEPRKHVLEHVNPTLYLEYKGVRIYFSYPYGWDTSPSSCKYVVANDNTTTDGIEFDVNDLDEWIDFCSIDYDCETQAVRFAIEAAIENGSIKPGFVALGRHRSCDPETGETGPSASQQTMEFINTNMF